MHACHSGGRRCYVVIRLVGNGALSTFLYFTSAVPPAPTFVSVSRPSDNRTLRRRFHACHRRGRNRSKLSAPRSYRENRVVRYVAFRSGGNGGLGGRRQ